MTLRTLFSFILITGMMAHAYSQRSCATDKMHSERAIQNPELYKQQEEYKQNLQSIIEARKSARLSGTNDLYIIPVVVHVVYHTSATHETNISDAQVISQITVLNEDFRKMANTRGANSNPIGADINLEFRLATVDPDGNPSSGIVRVLNSTTSWGADYNSEVTLKALSYWPSDKYLNLWVCSMGGGYLGYSQYPVGYTSSSISGPEGGANEIDGVVIDYRAFGRMGTAGNSPNTLYKYGRTSTHEIGHWLGLVHIWGEGAGCGTDYVSDTPDDAGANMDSDCNDQSDCDGDGTFIQDMTPNYLDYSPDVCMNIFTLGQKERMRTVLETAPRRKALVSQITSIKDSSVPLNNNYQAFLEQVDNVSCQLFDIMGKQIFQIQLQGNSKTLPLENLTTGLYILRAQGDNKEFVQKIYIP
jgi:hypothetical protein